MEDSSDPKNVPTTDENNVVEVDMSALSEAAATFSASITTFNKVAYTDKRQPSGRWAPAFPSILQDNPKHEEYIERMIARDKELNQG